MTYWFGVEKILLSFLLIIITPFIQKPKKESHPWFHARQINNARTHSVTTKAVQGDKFKESAKISWSNEDFFFYWTTAALPMWVHHANNHRGFCMEYKLSSLTSEFAENVFPVLYTQENINSKNILKQHFSGNKRVNPDRILMVPVIKSIDCTYEKQWRYVRDNPSVKMDFH